MAFAFVFRRSVNPPYNCNGGGGLEKRLIYLAVKAVAPPCLLLLLRPCPSSEARDWSGAKLCMSRAT